MKFERRTINENGMKLKENNKGMRLKENSRGMELGREILIPIKDERYTK